ncbi:hypothetical protein [Puniceibacterium sp. IMCC21224]|uniref:hypothetical protein n=1 Tax=Puniceibacterium sp. IMCC21224 TaxID=1618204 RepID=UPI00064D9FD0|nr:hypothetical protein [Puniceibacterium sp. IMCC21224]KMK65755.1 hypothetical protein IMCC21224_11590 [Puniceibacterium sp. IMCC21224]
MQQLIIGALMAILAATSAMAQDADKMFRLAVPDILADSGLMKYMLPRFSLKTATRVALVDAGAAADATFGDTGTVAFEGLGQVWRLEVSTDADAQRFADWLQSDAGRSAVGGFMADGVAVFSTEVTEKRIVAPMRFDGDAARGAVLSLQHCGRCHVVGAVNRMKAIGSTPSFAVLRTLSNWRDRFMGFYALNPHPAFTQVAEVTLPFDQSYPSPITPVEITLDELEDILAFVAAVSPADLGAPIQSQ